MMGKAIMYMVRILLQSWQSKTLNKALKLYSFSADETGNKSKPVCFNVSSKFACVQ